MSLTYTCAKCGRILTDIEHIGNNKNICFHCYDRKFDEGQGRIFHTCFDNIKEDVSEKVVCGFVYCPFCGIKF